MDIFDIVLKGKASVTNFNREKPSNQDPYLELSYAIVENACRDWVEDVKFLRNNYISYKSIATNPVKGLEGFLKDNNLLLYFKKGFEKENSVAYITKSIEPAEFAKNPDDYPRVSLSEVKSEKHKLIFEHIIDLIRLEHFFRSNWCYNLCDIEGDLILQKLKQRLNSHKKHVA